FPVKTAKTAECLRFFPARRISYHSLRRIVYQWRYPRQRRVAPEDAGASMIILGVHAGQHEASATLFDEYRVLGAVQMERLNRIKGAGVLPDEWAWPCVDEVLSMNGLTRRDVDAVALTRSALPQTYYLKMRTPWRRLAVRAKPEILQKRPHRLLVNALRKKHVADPS